MTIVIFRLASHYKADTSVTLQVVFLSWVSPCRRYINVWKDQCYLKHRLAAAVGKFLSFVGDMWKRIADYGNDNDDNNANNDGNINDENNNSNNTNATTTTIITSTTATNIMMRIKAT